MVHEEVRNVLDGDCLHSHSNLRAEHTAQQIGGFAKVSSVAAASLPGQAPWARQLGIPWPGCPGMRESGTASSSRSSCLHPGLSPRSRWGEACDPSVGRRPRSLGAPRRELSRPETPRKAPSVCNCKLRYITYCLLMIQVATSRGDIIR